MKFGVYSKTNGNTCAGAEIGSVMHDFSQDLFEGCKYNAHLAKIEEKIFKVRFANISCILFSISAVEAKLNEIVSMYAEMEKMFVKTGETSSIWSDVLNKHKRDPIAKKWNILVEKTGGKKWEHNKEPFQSFNFIKKLRNELVHYKGELLEKGDSPNKNIQMIMQKLSINSKTSFMEDDWSTWVDDLLNCRELASLVVQFILPVFDNMQEYLGHECFPES